MFYFVYFSGCGIRSYELFLANSVIFLADYNWVGCLANVSVSGQNSISEFKTVSVLIIH